MRQGRLDDAKKVLTRIASKGYYDNKNIDGYVAYLKHTNDLEKAEAKKGSFREMFQGSNLRRTEVMLVSEPQ